MTINDKEIASLIPKEERNGFKNFVFGKKNYGSDRKVLLNENLNEAVNLVLERHASSYRELTWLFRPKWLRWYDSILIGMRKIIRRK